jgi:hypothetical protein
MHENDHANNGNANSPNAHQEPNRDSRSSENPPGNERRRRVPDFPTPEPVDPEPEKSGAR